MTMKTKKTLQHIAAVAVVLLTLCLVFAAPVSAEGNVAKIGSTEYATLQDAVNNVSVGVDTTITIIGSGIIEGNGVNNFTGKKLTIDFNGCTYNVSSPLVGSGGTKSQAFHIESGSITFKNGIITSKDARMLVQNYANLTLENMVLDGTLMADATYGGTPGTPGPNYVLSNCVGTVVIKNTDIIAGEGDIAFDVYGTYSGSTSKLSVTVEGDSTIIGGIEFIDKADREVSLTINGGSFTDIANATRYAAPGAVIKLAKDVELTESIDIIDGMDVTIEGSGKTISISHSGKDAFFVNGGKLTLGEGLNVYSSTDCAVLIYDGELITSANLKTDADYGAIQGNGNYAGSVTVNGGTIESIDCGIYHPQNDALIINGGTIKGKTAVYFKSGSLSVSGINGGTLIGIGAATEYVYNSNGCDATGDALVIENVGGDTGYEAITSLSITGGTFISENAKAVASYAPAGSTPVTAFITGGTFSSDPSAYVAPKYAAVPYNGQFLVQKMVEVTYSGSSTTEPEEPEQPEQPVEPTPETPAAPGEVAVSTEVTDGGDVTFETPAGEDGTAPAAADDEVKGVVLPTGTEGTVEFVPVSEQPAPAGQEENTKRVFEINVPSYKKGEASVIKFQMTVAEIEADGKTAADVALWHYDEETGEWTKLVTSFIIKDGIVYFEAITNDFSPFAIIYEDETAGDLPTDTPETPEQPEEPASPAPVLAVLAALGAAVVLRRK